MDSAILIPKENIHAWRELARHCAYPRGIFCTKCVNQNAPLL
jgi:hypothetical protein